MSGKPDSEHHVHVGGSVLGQVVSGNHNVVVTITGSSTGDRSGPEPTLRRLTRPVSAPLPKVGVELLGRDRELASLARWVEEGLPVEVYGAPGVGRSALLRRFAVDRAAQGADVVFLHAAGLAVDDIVQELFQSCYDATGYIPEQKRLRRLMGSISALIVVDDFGGTAENLTTLIDALPAADLVVSTTRRTLSGQGHALELEGLEETAALALFVRELRGDPAADAEVARELCLAARGHPRAIVQAAAWLRDGGATSAMTDPDVLRDTVLAGLPHTARQVLSALAAAGGAALPPGLCEAMTGESASAVVEALAELERLHVVDRAGSGFRSAVDPEALTGAATATPLDIGGYVQPLLDWVTGVATQKEIAAASPVLVRVLESAVAGRHPVPACALARAIAPVLAVTLRWGAWRSVLRLGESAAAASGSAADLAYFRHEELVRSKALGIASAAAVSAGVGAGLVAGQAITAATARQSVPAVISSHPVAAGCVATVLIAGGIATATIITDQPVEVGSQAALTSAIVTLPAIPATDEPLVTTTVEETPPQQSTTTSRKPETSHTTTPKIPDKGNPGPGNTGGGTDNQGAGSGADNTRRVCPPFIASNVWGTFPFKPVAVGQSDTQTVKIPWYDCIDENRITFESANGVFKVVSAVCPPKNPSDLCEFTVKFAPRSPGTPYVGGYTFYPDGDDVSNSLITIYVTSASGSGSSPADGAGTGTGGGGTGTGGGAGAGTGGGNQNSGGTGNQSGNGAGNGTGNPGGGTPGGAGVGSPGSNGGNQGGNTPPLGNQGGTGAGGTGTG